MFPDYIEIKNIHHVKRGKSIGKGYEKSQVRVVHDRIVQTYKGNDHCKWFTSPAGREIWIMIGRMGVLKKGWLIDLL